MNEDQKAIARSLLLRAGLSSQRVESISDDDLADTLDLVSEIFDERDAPDDGWRKDLYSLSGDHWVLTDEGWCPADYAGEFDEYEIIDEVNRPSDK